MACSRINHLGAGGSAPNHTLDLRCDNSVLAIHLRFDYVRLLASNGISELAFFQDCGAMVVVGQHGRERDFRLVNLSGKVTEVFQSSFSGESRTRKGLGKKKRKKNCTANGTEA